MNTKKAIVQYLGQQFGEDARVTLESGEMLAVPVPKDPADDYEDEKYAAGDTTKTARQKVSYVNNMTFEKEIAEYLKRKQMLQTNLEKAFSIILGQCTYNLQKNWRQIRIGQLFSTLRILWICWRQSSLQLISLMMKNTCLYPSIMQHLFTISLARVICH